jgi:hypothetical protein
VFGEFLYEYVLDKLDIVIYWVQGINPRPYVSDPCGDLFSLNEGERNGYLPDWGVEFWYLGVCSEVAS